MISRPIWVPTERARDLNMPLPTTCSTTEGSSSGPLSVSGLDSALTSALAFGFGAARISSGPFAPRAAFSLSYADSLSTACAYRACGAETLTASSRAVASAGRAGALPGASEAVAGETVSLSLISGPCSRLTCFEASFPASHSVSMAAPGRS